MSPFFNSFGKLLVFTVSFMKKCSIGANKFECSVRIFTGMLPKVEDFVRSKSLSRVSIFFKETCWKENFSLSYSVFCLINLMLEWLVYISMATSSGSQAGADPKRNLTRAQPKARGCGYMGVALREV